MSSMVVTLEVSKLSGWLKAYADCRVEGRACDAGGRGASREAGEPGVWWRHTSGMHGDGPTQGWGPRARAERTQNILLMSVTLEVSKLSGWLKADTSCRVEGRACDAGGRGGSRKAGESLGCGGGTQEACKRMARLKAGGQGHARSAPKTCRSCQCPRRGSNV
jgi:hypothetical protein